jgi:hypothetical protein
MEPGFVAGRTIGSPIWEKPPSRRAVERPGAFSEEQRSVHSDSATSQNVVVSPKIPTFSAQVVNGERSEYGQWPWQISLRQWRTGDYFLFLMQ